MLFSHVDTNNNPESLVIQCFNCISKNLDEVFGKTDKGYIVKNDGPLPDELGQQFLHIFQKSGGIIDDKVANIFVNSKKSRLTKAFLWNADISNNGAHSFIKKRLEELSIGYSKNITFKIFDIINTYGENLRKLRIEYGMSRLVYAPSSHRSSNLDYFAQRGYVMKLPKLESLALKACRVPLYINFYKTLLQALPNIKYLDLSSCEGLHDFTCLEELQDLRVLILFDLNLRDGGLKSVCKLKKLECLDVSQGGINGSSLYDRENDTLAMIVESLPNLTCLDISCTNLAGTGTVQRHLLKKYGNAHSDIPGLTSRNEKPLEFLGLYNCTHGACRRFEIPALTIAGEGSEKQLLVAGRAYMYRPVMLLKVLGDLFHLIREKNHQDPFNIIDIVLKALLIHNKDKAVQISGSAAMFSVFKSKDIGPVPSELKRHIIRTMLYSMITHKNDDVIIRNGCLTLCQFHVPHDFLFIYEELVKFLLEIISSGKSDSFIQRITMYLLNSLGCQVDDSQKFILGDLLVIEKMLNLIRNRVSVMICDDVLEIAWSTMWNVTDETPINCKRFLDDDGMACFRSCLDKFHDKSELMRNMMGLLGNVAEVEELRPRLLEYVPIFHQLLQSEQDGIEVSYNAAGVLAHLASDGAGAWDESAGIEREVVMQRMSDAIDKWSIRSDRNINYRSFKPILRLAECYHTSACQYWAVWALANLTTVYIDKYCPIVEREGGLDILRKIIFTTSVPHKIVELATVVVTNWERYENGDYEKSENGNSIEDIDADEN